MEEIKCDGKESISATGKNDNSDNQLINSQFDENANLESQHDQDFTASSILDGGDISREFGNADILDTENGKSLTGDNLDTENGKLLTGDILDTENGKSLTGDNLDTENGKLLTSDNLDTENGKLLTSAETETEKEDEWRSSESEIAKGTEDLLTELGNPGKFVICQILLHCLCVFGISSPALIYVFIGYEPPHQCRKMTNESTYLASSELPNSSVHLVYDTCSISVVRNSSGEFQTVDTIGCIQGNDYGGQQHISFVAEWDLVCDRLGLTELVQTLMMAGQTVGSIVFTSLADKFGRKSVLMACNALLLGSGIGAAYSPNVYALLVFRFLAGFFQQGVSCVGYTMIVEFLTSRHRRIAGVLCGLNWTISVLFLALFAYLMRDYSWRSLQLLSALFACNVFLYPFLLVESPRWLIANKRYKEALAIIKRMSIMNGKDFEKVRRIFKHNVMRKQLNSHQNELIANAPERKVERYSVLDILRHKRLLISSLIIWFAWATNVITYYGLFLTSSSLAGNRHLNFFLMALVDIPGDGTNFILLKFFGRKPVLMFLMTFAGSSLLSATLLMSFGTNAVTQTLSTVFSLAGKFGIGASFNAIFLYTPELFPTNLRSAGLGLCSSISRLSGMVAPYSKLLGDVVIWGPGTIFSTMCFLSVLMFTQLPETRGRALPNTISEMKEWSTGKQLFIRDNHAGSKDQVNNDAVINNSN